MKKLLAMMLALVLAVGMLSTLAFAEEEAAAEDAVQEEIAAEEEISAEDIIAEPEYLPTPVVNLSENGEVILEDYSVIEVPESAVQVSDLEVESYINSILEYSTTTETITEGTAEDGDTVNIDFSGVLEGEEEPFDGGTAQGYTVVLGSGTFIPGFEDQIIGHEIGETFDILVTFPEEYTEEMAGKNATFTITLNYKSVSVVPELTDEFVQEFTTAEFESPLNTVEELQDYTYDYLYTNYLDNAIMDAMMDKMTVVSYDEEKFELIKAYSLESLEYTVLMYASYGLEGYTVDDMAQMYGYESADAFTTSEAISSMDVISLLDKIAEDLGIEITDEEVDEAIANYMKMYGYDTMYDVDSFKEMSGEGWVLLIRTMQVEYQKDLEVLEERAVLVEDPEAAEASAEEAAVSEDGLMNYAAYNAAQIDDEVTVAIYVQDHQDWWDGKITVYGADKDGAYFVYEMACTEEDAEKLVPGTKIIVNGFKSEWSGEVEIVDATFTFAEDGDTYIAEPMDITEYLGTDELIDYINRFVSFNGLTIEASADEDGNEAAFLYKWNGSGTQGDDLYFKGSVNGQTFTFTVESYLRGADTEVYKAVEALQIGDVVDMEGFLYWYEGANPHITSVTVK